MNECILCAFSDEASPALEGQIAALHRNGIGYMELRGVDGVNVADLDAAAASDIRARLDDAGIRVWSLGSPIGKVDINQPEVQEYDRLCRLIETARLLGAQCIRLFSFYGTGGEQRWFEPVCRRLERMLAAARGSGVGLCHENEKGIFGDVPERCAALHRELPDLGAVFDPANFIQCGADVLSAWEQLSPYVRYGHIKDADAAGHVVPAGEGVGHIADYLPHFFADSHRVLTLEPHLTRFIGLDKLETGTPNVGTTGAGALHTSAHAFADGNAAFDYAVAALRRILDRIGVGEARL